MNFKEFCSCCWHSKSKKLDIRSSGYYDSSISDTESCNYFRILEMTPDNYQDILSKNKFVLMQFNDGNSVNDDFLVSAWHETVEIIAEQNIVAAEIFDRKFLERLGIHEDSATEGLITQLYKNGKFLGAFNHNKYDVCTQNYVNFVNYAKRPLKPAEKLKFSSINEDEEKF